MKKTIIICGLISGLIVSTLMIAEMAKCISDPGFEGSMLLGYTTMLVALSLIFVAVKNARDKHGTGFITFGKAFKIGLQITLIASTIYVVTWMIDYYFFIPDFYEKYVAHHVAHMKASGASQAAIQKEITDGQAMGKIYRNPLVCAMFTYLEILPVGLIVSLVCALVLKKKAYTGMPAMDN